MGGRRDAGGIPPPILFLAPQKENGPWTVQEKKRFRGGAACLIPGKSLPAPWYRREFGGSRLPPLLVPLPLPRSAQGAQRKKETGASPISHSRAIHAAGFVFPDFCRSLSPRSVLFFWTVHCAAVGGSAAYGCGIPLAGAARFLFGKIEKKMGGCIPAGKAGIPRAEAARPPCRRQRMGGGMPCPIGQS